MKIVYIIQGLLMSFLNKKIIRNSARFLSVIVLGTILSLSPLTSLVNLNTRIAYAANESFNSPENKSADAGEVIAITDLQITGDGNDTLNMTLYVARGSFSFEDARGLTFSGDEEGNNLKFSGTREDINAALLTLEYTAPYVGGTFEIEALIDEGDGSVYRHANGHVYRVVEVDGGITWTAARAAAEALTFPGTDGTLNGYLATIADEEENNFILARIDQDGWIGASDDSALTLGYEDENEGNNEGEWFWVTGPEAGTKFWTGGRDGSVVGDEYANWNKVNPSNEPNNTGGAENCAEMRFSSNGNGRWNDLPCESSRPNYVVEFGEPGNDPIVMRTTFDVTVAAPEFIPVEQCFTADEPGVYGLVEDITDVEGDCILIQSDDVVIEGNGFSIVGVEDNVDEYTSGIYNQSAVSGVDIRNIGIQNFLFGIKFHEVSDISIDNVTIVTAEVGISVEGLVNEVNEQYDTVSITNSTIENILDLNDDVFGIRVYAMKDVVIDGNTLSSVGGDGVYLRFVSDVTVSNNTFSEIGSDAIDLSNLNGIEEINTNVTISSNTASDTGDRGFEIEYVAGGLVENNTISSYNNAIEIDDSSNFIVRDNSFTTTGDSEFVIAIKYTDGATLLENQIIGNSWVTVNEENTSNIVFSENRVGNSYFLLDETPAWEIFDIKDNNNNGYADVGADLPFADGLSYSLGEGDAISTKGDEPSQQDYEFNNEGGDGYLYDNNEATGFEINYDSRIDLVYYSPNGSPENVKFHLVHNEGTSVVDIPSQCTPYDEWNERYNVFISLRVNAENESINILCGDGYSEGMHIYGDFEEVIEGVGSEITVYEAWITYNESNVMTLWEGAGQDNHPATEVIATPTPIPSSSRRVIGSYTRANTVVQNTIPASTNTSNEGQCSADMILTQNLKAGARNGQYHAYTKAVVTEVKILQTHMNRLGFNSGVVDGILGPITDGAIKRMQTYLGTKADGYVGPITRSLINASCGSEGLKKSI